MRLQGSPKMLVPNRDCGGGDRKMHDKVNRGGRKWHLYFECRAANDGDAGQGVHGSRGDCAAVEDWSGVPGITSYAEGVFA